MTIHHRHGFTLVETLIYLVLIGIIMPSVLYMTYTAFTVRSEVRAMAILNENVRFATNRINTLVHTASSITSPTVTSASSTLTLSMTTASEDPTRIYLSNGVLTLKQGASPATALTSSEVAFSQFALTRVSSTIPMIQIVLTGGLRNAINTFPTLTVTTTASVRR